LRGINVGGKHSVPMQDLRDILGDLDCHDVRTYIQSGNAVFDFSGDPQVLQGRVSSTIEQKFGFAPITYILTFENYQAVLDANPFPEAVNEPKTIHVGFLTEPAVKPDIEAIENLKSPTENYCLVEGAFYLHAPDGIGRSKLAAKIDKCLGVATTGRNWRSATKIAALAATVTA
jgi:uncharacterized protein (DUF1697 family)